MAHSNIPSNIASDDYDDRPAPSVYPIDMTEQHDLVESTLLHMNAIIHHVEEHSGQPIEPPAECPANSRFQRLHIGSRNSQLALIQASSIAAALFKIHHPYNFPISTHKVQGDVDKKSPFLNFASMYKDTPDAAKGLWTLELEERLLAGDIDVIIHSLKDVPTVLPAGCALGVFPHRQDPTDAFVVKAGSLYRTLDELPAGSVVGTSSIRRTAQLKHFYPHLNVRECRGNVDSRLAKLDAPDSPYAAIVIATAGLIRMNLEHRITTRLTGPEFLYAVGQGALGVEVRSTDENTHLLIRPLDHRPTRIRCLAERSLLRYLQGGCSAPIGVQSSFEGVGEGGVLSVTGALLHPHGGVEIRAHTSGVVESDADAENLGVAVAKRILELGGGPILAFVKNQQALSQMG